MVVWESESVKKATNHLIRDEKRKNITAASSDTKVLTARKRGRTHHYTETDVIILQN